MSLMRMHLVWTALSLLVGSLSPAAGEVDQSTGRATQSPEGDVVRKGDTLFGLPLAGGAESPSVVFEAIAPKQLLELGPGSATRLLIERFPSPYEKSGSAETKGYLHCQNLTEGEWPNLRFPYFGTQFTAYGRMNDSGVSVITHLHVQGSFEPEGGPFRKGGRAEARALISALCKAFGKPLVHTRTKPVDELRFETTDSLVWSPTGAKVFLWFQSHKTTTNLHFHLDVVGPAKLPEFEKELADHWEKATKPMPADFAKRFDEYCDRVNFDRPKR